MQKDWEKDEKQDAKKFHTQQQPLSGRMDAHPTDSISDEFTVDTKRTNKKSYSISIRTWNKLCEENAILNNKDLKNRTPIISLHLQDKHLVIISFEDFQKLISAY